LRRDVPPYVRRDHLVPQFVKPTEVGREYIGMVVEAPPYEGAKNCFLIEDEIEDAEWLTELFVITEEELPAPKPKKKRKKKGSS